MEKKIISFKGISNVPDDGLNEAGDMSVLLNMRHKGGELVPCQPPAVDDSLAMPIKQALYHSSSGFWLVLNQTGILQEWSASLNKRIYVENVSSFSIMGNMVIISFENKVEYAIWKEDKYLLLGGLPEVPILYCNNYNVQQIREEVALGSGKDDPDSTNYDWRFQKGAIDKALASIYQIKGYVDRAWFRVGIKMFDGSYLAIGDIRELTAYPNMASKDANGIVKEKIAGAQKLWGRSSANTAYTELDYFVPEFQISERLNNWKDVIASIDLFSTGSITSFAAGFLNKDDTGVDVPAGIEVYKTRTAKQMKEAMLNAEFHKVAEYDVNGELTWSVEETSPSMIAVQPTLSDVTVHHVIPNETYYYNARLHTGDYKEVYFKGYSSPTTFKSGLVHTKDKPWTVYVHINTENGVMIVKRKDGPMFDDTEDVYKHMYYFSYPDSRAFKMEIFQNGKKQSLALSPHPTRNEAYNLKIVTAEVELSDYGLVEIPVIYEGEWTSSYGEPTERNGIERKNILKVSAVDNPFYFPTAQTYKFEGEIKGLASNAEAISPGQFGQFPLHVFTDTGIWAMQVDTSGQGAYTTQSPFSREVCSGAVCPVSGGVVFTTKRGLMAISGGQVTELSKPLDGLAPTDGVKYSLIVDNEDWVIKHREGGNYTREYDGANLFISDKNNTEITPDGLQNGLEVNVRNTAAGQNFMATVRVSKKYVFYSNELTGEIFKRASIENHEKFVPVPIREYINGAKLAYNYLHNEVILSNVNYGYSYVYSLDSQTWGMVDTKFDITTNSYPELVVYNNQEMKRYTFDDTTTGVVPVVAITRPFTLGSLDFKRLRQAALRCTFDGQLNFYLLGSNDGASFVCITGKEHNEVKDENGKVKTQRDLITAMSRSKQYKYFAIAIAGQMSGRVSMAELLVDAGFAVNKLR